MSDTPRTDKAQKEYEDENYDAAVYPEFARQLEREIAAKDAEIADIRAERLRNETFWLGFLQDKLAAQQKSTNEKNTTQTSF